MTGWLAAGITGVLALACSGKTADGTHPPDAGQGEAAPPNEPSDASSEPPDAPYLDAAEPVATLPDGAPDATACDEARVLTGNFRVNQGGYYASTFIETDRVGLNGVTAIEGSLALTDVRDLTLLRCLRRVSGDLSIGARTECFVSATSCFVGTNPVLTSLEGLNQLEEVGGRLALTENPSLVDMSALSALRRLGSFTITSCPLLTDLSGLEGIASVNELSITANEALLTLSGLENLTTAETVVVSGNRSLASLSSLSSLTAVSSTLNIYGNPSLPDCEAEAFATQVGMTCTAPEFYTSPPITCTGICTCDGNDGNGMCR